MKRLLAIAALALSGCGAEEAAPDGGAVRRSATPTGFAETVRETVVTNIVYVTNTVTVAAEPPRTLSLRRTAPYLAAGDSLTPEQLRKLASECGARVVECTGGALALVEASDAAVDRLRAGGILKVHPLTAQDKIARDAGSEVRIIPMSTIDCAAVVKAVRGSGGEILQVITAGSPAVRAKMSFASVKEIAGRGDVRRIERDGK